MSNLENTAGLLARLEDPDLRVIDARYDLKDPAAGRAAWERGHIPGAVHLDLGSDLSGPPARHGGRHPLPDPEELAATFGRAGIGPGTSVVAYDAEGGMFAARVWWLLRWLGFTEVRVLDGGFRAWTGEGHPVTSEVPPVRPAEFRGRPQPEMVTDRAAVLAAAEAGGTLLIDARAPARFRGETAEMDPVPGRVPGAVNRPHTDNFGDDGRFLAPDRLRALYGDLPLEGSAIAYCGSGVSATVDLLAIAEAGLPLPQLYAGSFSDWITYPDSPVEKG